MAFAGATALAILERIGNDNRKGEYLSHRCHRDRPRRWVTRRSSSRPRRTTCAASTPRHSSRRPKRRCSSACAGRRWTAGVTLVAPETVFLSSDTKFGRDVVVEPFVVFGPGVVVEDNALSSARSRISTARSGQGRGGRPLCSACGPVRACGETCTSATSSRSRKR